uniref:type IV pilus modification PilV family protein n=1 Tax=Candidatus Electronema sp. TaxID=2698783 RepID=UPI004056C9BB
MKVQRINRQAGFTLIETLMAMAIFTIGILGLFGMQTAVIKKNLTANNITNGATWAADQVERVISLDYSHFEDGAQLGCDGLDDWGDKGLADSSFEPPELMRSGDIEPIYKIYWNVAQGCVMSNLLAGTADDGSDEYRPKYLRIIVTRQNSSGPETEVAVFNYIKQNSRN